MQLFTRIFYFLRGFKSSIGGRNRAVVVRPKGLDEVHRNEWTKLPNKLAEVHRNGWTKLTE